MCGGVEDVFVWPKLLSLPPSFSQKACGVEALGSDSDACLLVLEDLDPHFRNVKPYKQMSPDHLCPLTRAMTGNNNKNIYEYG